VLRYYRVYRALVRAKVAMLRRGQTTPGSEPFQQATSEYHQYAHLAAGYLSPRPAALLITHGLSGSGKSTLAHQLCERAGMIQIRSDIERKRLAGMAATDRSHSEIGAGLYTAGQTEQTYRQLGTLASFVLQAGYSAVVDATFLRQAQRKAFSDLAAALQVPFIILHCDATDEELERRITARAAAGRDPSEAGLDVLRAQQQASEALHAPELARALRVDTQAMDLEKLQGKIDQLCRVPARRDSQQ
jgi:predicted kinase